MLFALGHGRAGRGRGALAVFAVWMAISGAAMAETITVFAAASLRGALDAVADDYAAQTGDKVVVSYAGSSALARQIGFGAPADVFLSANPDWMDVVDRAGLLRGPSVDLLGNRLVLVAPDPVDLPDLAALPEILGTRRLAMALVDAVPAGIYGKTALQSLDLWDAVERHVVQTDNVRAALALVALGEAAFGVVYATDAQAEPRVHVVATFPAETHAPILYPAAALTDRGAPFVTYLTGPKAMAQFAAHGFLPLATP